MSKLGDFSFLYSEKMELSVEQYIELNYKFINLLQEFIFVVRKYKFCCDHFLFAAQLFDDVEKDFLKPKESICGLILLSKINYLLRTLKRIESLQNHGACLFPPYNG